MSPSRKRVHRLSAVTLVSVLAPLLLHADDWPQWRGPNGDGTSGERGLPAKWSRTDDVVWRLKLPGPAGSTPAV